MYNGTINIHAILKCSGVNGPGNRIVVFFQGCTRNCKGCFNPATHSMEPARMLRPADILSNYPDNIEGVTISGGEPFQQPDGLTELLMLSQSYDLSTVVYTGYLIEELLANYALKRPLKFIDALVDGPFEADKLEPTLLARGSTNQRIHLLTERYKEEDFILPAKSEFIIAPDGTMTGTGFGAITLQQKNKLGA